MKIPLGTFVASVVLTLLTIPTLCGQSPDSVNTPAKRANIALFPVWIPAESIAGEPNSVDHPVLDLPTPAAASRQQLAAQRLLGIGMVVAFGSLSYHYHREAESSYRAYKNSGNPAELDELFRQTERLDRLAGWSYVGAETGLILIAFSYVLHP